MMKIRHMIEKQQQRKNLLNIIKNRTAVTQLQRQGKLLFEINYMPSVKIKQQDLLSDSIKASDSIAYLGEYSIFGLVNIPKCIPVSTDRLIKSNHIYSQIPGYPGRKSCQDPDKILAGSYHRILQKSFRILPRIYISYWQGPKNKRRGPGRASLFLMGVGIHAESNLKYVIGVCYKHLPSRLTFTSPTRKVIFIHICVFKILDRQLWNSLRWNYSQNYHMEVKTQE